MTTLREIVTEYLVARDIPHVFDPSGVLGFLGGSDKGSWMMYIAVLEEDQQVLVHSVLDDPVPVKRRNDLALLLTRADYGIVVGNFVDMDGGEVRYKTSIDVEGDALSDALFENLVIANAAMMDRYLPAIEAVAKGGDPSAALAAAEAR